MKKFIRNFVIISFMLMMMPLGAKALSGRVYLNGGSTSVKAGGTTTFTLRADGSSPVGGIQYSVSSPDGLEILSVTDSATGEAACGSNFSRCMQVTFSSTGKASGSPWTNITVRVPNGAKEKTEYTLYITNVGISLDEDLETTFPAADASIKITVAPNTTNNGSGNNSGTTTPTVQQTKKSNDATLKDLIISNVTGFEFDRNKTNYTITVGYDVTSLDLKAVLNDSKATYVVEGNENFVVGHNTVTITVTAEDGTKKTYTLDVIRSEKEVNQEICEPCTDIEGTNTNLIWIIISCVLGVLLATETGYIIYDKTKK